MDGKISVVWLEMSAYLANFADPEVFLELLNCQVKRAKAGQYFVVARIIFNNSPNFLHQILLFRNS